jgi:hypothetical protein
MGFRPLLAKHSTSGGPYVIKNAAYLSGLVSVRALGLTDCLWLQVADVGVRETKHARSRNQVAQV